MTFKVKKEKKVKVCNTNKNIDQIHQEKMEYFDRLQDSLERRREFLKTPRKSKVCKYCLDTLNPKKECQTCFEKMHVDSKLISITEFEQKIKDIVEYKEQNEYFLNCNQLLLEYYSSENTLLSENTRLSENETEKLNTQMGIVQISYDHKKEILKDYCELNNIVYHEKKLNKLVDYCTKCNEEIKETEEKYWVCFNCGKVGDKVIDGISYKDVTENYRYPSSSFDYKRINYFNEWLNHIQAKEQIEIDEETLNKIKIELHKERITDSSKVSHQKIKKILKIMNEPKLYDHIPVIISKICNIKPLSMSLEIVEKLKQMFMAIQYPFELSKGPNRKNFFSYSYVIYKFCELLGLYDFLPHFQLLKSREKLIKQDILWKSIIQYLKEHETSTGVDWVFIASV